MDSFQEVDLEAGGFSNDFNGEEVDTSSSTSLKSEAGENQSEPKTNEKSASAVSQLSYPLTFNKIRPLQ